MGKDSSGAPTLSDAQAVEDATALVGRLETLVDAQTVAQTKHNISQVARPQPGCFSLAEHLIYTSLRKHYFPEYLQSDSYYQYLSSELLHVPLAAPRLSGYGRAGRTFAALVR